MPAGEGRGVNRPPAQGKSVTGALAERQGTTEPGGQVAVRIDPLKRLLNSMQAEVEKQLPSHIPAEYYMRTVLTGMRKSDALAKLVMTERGKASLFAALLESARYGLMPFTEEAAIVTFGGKNPTATFIPQYKGLIKTMLNSGQVAAVEARLIYANDEWDLSYGDGGRFYHKPRLFNDDGTAADRGDPILAYCYVRLMTGARSSVVFLTRQEAIEIRDKFSRSYQNAEKSWNNEPPKRNSTWHLHFDSMWVKSAIRRQNDVPRSAMLSDLLLAAARDDTNAPPESAPPKASDIGGDESVLEGEFISETVEDGNGGQSLVVAPPDFDRTKAEARYHALMGEVGMGKDSKARLAATASLRREDIEDDIFPVKSSKDLSDDELERVNVAVQNIRDASEDPKARADTMFSMAAQAGWTPVG